MCFFNLKKKDLSHVFEKDCQILSPKGSEEWISDTLEKYLRIGSTNTFESIWSALGETLSKEPKEHIPCDIQPNQFLTRAN